MNGTSRVRLPGAFLWGILMAMPVLAGDAPGTGIAGSPHDFTRFAEMAGEPKGRIDSCAFCHFEDRTGDSDPTTARVMLAWSQRLSTQSFFWSSGITLQGTKLPTNITSWAGSSKMCLGCHGERGSLDDLGPSRYQVASLLDGVFRADDSNTGLPLWAGGHRPSTGVAAAAATLSARHMRIGVNGDLEGTHPVGIPYPYQGVPGRYNDISTGRQVDIAGFVPAPTTVKLFTSDGKKIIQGARVGASGVECASCHDVHNADVHDRWLLRDTARQLCLDCHNL